MTDVMAPTKADLLRSWREFMDANVPGWREKMPLMKLPDGRDWRSIDIEIGFPDGSSTRVTLFDKGDDAGEGGPNPPPHWAYARCGSRGSYITCAAANDKRGGLRYTVRAPTMAELSRPFWQNKAVLQWVELLALVGTAVAGAVAASLTEPADRFKAASVGGVFVLIGGLAKLQSKRVEDREKAEQKKEQDALREKSLGQAKRMARAVLSHMHDHFFEREAQAEKYKHRITLFVCIPDDEDDDNKKRLILYARWGGYNANSTTSWEIDESRPGGCPGVAGLVWETNTTHIRVASCDWPESPNDHAAKDCYARSLLISVAQAEALAVKSRYFGGALVFSRGEKWGVLLVDSLKDFRHPNTQQYNEEKQIKRLERYATMLGKLVAEDGV